MDNNKTIDCRSRLGLLIGNIDSLISLNRLAIEIHTTKGNDSDVQLLVKSIELIEKHISENNQLKYSYKLDSKWPQFIFINSK